MKIETPVKIKLSDYKPYEYIIPQINLEFELGLERTIVKSKMNIEKNPKSDYSGNEIKLNAENLEIISLKINGEEVDKTSYNFSNDILTINNFKAPCTLETEVAINPLANKALSGLYVSSNRFCTQCEAEGFRRITPWPDRPDVMSSFTVKITANKEQYPVLLSNGNETSYKENADGTHTSIWFDPWLKPSYLFALVAGKLDKISDNFTTMEGRKVSLNIYVDEGNGPKALYAMDSLKRAMKWDEEVYKRPYDLDIFNIVAVRDFNAGAMENKGLNIFNSSLLLADKETATDMDFARIEGVIAHEYFHNWSGDRVTCRDWFQLSLKEGLTVFRDQEFSSDMRSRAVCRIQDVTNLRARQFAEDAGPNAHSVRPSEYSAIDNFYTATIYDKGAEVIRVANKLLGDENFYKGAVHYFEKNDGTAATIEDWLAALREASGNPLNGIERWYSQAGTPIVSVSSELIGEKFIVKLSQKTEDTPNQSNKDWVPIPLHMAFFNQNGAKISLKNEKGVDVEELHLNLDSKEKTLEFFGVNEKPVLSLLRGFSAPVKLVSDLTNEDLQTLASFDDDAFVKWDSLQTLAKREIIKGSELIAKAQEFVPDEKIVFAYNEAAKLAKNDYAYGALLLMLPGTNNLIQDIDKADPDNIFKAREILATAIAKANLEIFDDFINKYDFASEFIPDAKGAGLRSFVGSSLFYLSFIEGKDKEIYQYFKAAENMTDTMSALSALARIGGEYWQKALDDFYNKWNANSLVMDKWFSIQSVAASNKNADIVEKLINHKDFDFTNPNRVRSVVASFAMANPIGFNAKDGSGYNAIANIILKLDKINPMVTARLATSFERVVSLEETRRAKAKEALTKISSEKLSPQLEEIIFGILKSL